LRNDGPVGAEVGYEIVCEISCPGNERQRDEVYIMQRFMHRFPFSVDSSATTQIDPLAALAYLGAHPRIN